jgi:membrane fusion protein (multidrug efflux system)
MNSPLPVFPALPLLAALGWLATGCQKPAAPVLPPPIVQVVTLTTTNVPMSAEVIGQLDSPQNVEVRARVEAFVEEVLYQDGVMVKEGAPLFRLDDRPFRERLKGAEGALAEAKAQLAKYQKDVARLQPLAEKKAIPQQDLENAQAAVEVGEAGVLTAKARVESALLDLGYCDVRAPIAGLIGAKQVSIGELVGKGQPTLLATLSTIDSMWFYCAISEVEYLKADAEVRRTGRRIADQPVALILADGSTHPAPGRFVFMDRAVDPKTGTLRVRAEFPNPDRNLRPGMFGRLRVDLGQRTNTITVPERALAELQGRHFVWVVSPEGTATQRTVQVGEKSGPRILVTSGLQAGERIVVEGLQKVREGAPVKAMTAQELAAAAAQAQTQAHPARKE